MTPPPPELDDDIIRDILLRFPATPLPLGSSKDLLRASLVCKRWRRILLDPAFLRYYREVHDAPPLLGFLLYRHGWWTGKEFFFHERFAVVEGDSLYLWSQPAGRERPSLVRFVDVRAMLPGDAPSFSPIKFGLEKDTETVCLGTGAGTFVVELGSGRVTKTGGDGGSSISFVPPRLGHVNKDYLTLSSASVRDGHGEENAMPCNIEGANLSQKRHRDENHANGDKLTTRSTINYDL